MDSRLPSGYFGEALRSARIEGADLSTSRYAAGTRLARHEHEHAHFCFVLEGVYRERIGARDHERCAMDLVWYPAQASHAEGHLTPGRHLLIDLGSRADEVGAEGVRVLREPAALRAAIHLARRLAEPSTALEEGEALASLLACVVRPASASYGEPHWLQRVEGELRERFREEIHFGELARSVGVSQPHLARTWRRYRGRSLGEMQRSLRVAYVSRRLRARATPLAEVAVDAGFADQSHMGRVFRRHMGCTPARFRALAL